MRRAVRRAEGNAMSVSVRARVPTYALALVIAGGAIWVLAAAA